MLPEPSKNNEWFRYTGSDTVLIFVHGIFSDSRGCWMYSEPVKYSGVLSLFGSKPVVVERYWPSLVADDARFANVDVYLAGFKTDIDATSYNLEDCAIEVYDKLSNPRAPAAEPVMAKRNLIFVGHSTGGIVARALLLSNERAFQEKNVGLVLMASPSTGSVYANRFDFLTQMYQSELGAVLRKDSTLLAYLDDRFKEAVDRKKEHIPRLLGAEACEHHMVFRRKIFGRRVPKWIPLFEKRLIVDPDSAGRYFGKVRKIPDSDHFSIVKPPSINHDSHDFLFRFWYRFQNELMTSESAKPQSVAPEMAPPLSNAPQIGREEILAQARLKLAGGGGCAFYGPAGRGKTFVASAVAHDTALRALFRDGVLWGSLSGAKDAGALFSTWADALGISRSSIAQLRRVDDRARAVANEIDQRRMLIICEDCETAEAAILVRMVGTNCARLITTQSRDVAETFAGKGNALELQALATRMHAICSRRWLLI